MGYRLAGHAGEGHCSVPGQGGSGNEEGQEQDAFREVVDPRCADPDQQGLLYGVDKAKEGPVLDMLVRFRRRRRREAAARGGTFPRDAAAAASRRRLELLFEGGGQASEQCGDRGGPREGGERGEVEREQEQVGRVGQVEQEVRLLVPEAVLDVARQLGLERVRDQHDRQQDAGAAGLHPRRLREELSERERRSWFLLATETRTASGLCLSLGLVCTVDRSGRGNAIGSPASWTITNAQ